MSRLKVMPISENREKAINYFIKLAKAVDPNVRRGTLNHERERILRDERDFIPIYMAANVLGAMLLSDAVCLAIVNSPQVWNVMSEGLAVGFLASELSKCQREEKPALYCRGGGEDLLNIAFHATLSGLCRWREADVICNHLLNLWLGGGIDEAAAEQDDFLAFYWLLLLAQHDKKWPSVTEQEAKELGEFYPLFNTVADPEQFSNALVRYCDFRLARMHGYPNQHTSKHYHEFHSDALTYGPLQFFPAELLAFKAIYERTTGYTCNLKGDHPLLKLPIMKPPSDLTLPENQYTKRICEVGEKAFGKLWNPTGLVEVRFDNPPTL